MSFNVQKVFLIGKDENIHQTVFDEEDCNLDVIVVVEEKDEIGKVSINKYISSFFTYKNIETQRRIQKSTDMYLSGKYFWVDNMLLIERCSENLIRQVIDELIAEGDFIRVFKKL